MDQMIRQRAELWTKPPYDEKTRLAAQALLEGNETECADAFYRDLEFGTGGLRGILGVGTNRMNVYVVALATQGFANYLAKQCQEEKLEKRVALPTSLATTPTSGGICATCCSTERPPTRTPFFGTTSICFTSAYPAQSSICS